jgi:hypothetical protein
LGFTSGPKARRTVKNAAQQLETIFFSEDHRQDFHRVVANFQGMAPLGDLL